MLIRVVFASLLAVVLVSCAAPDEEPEAAAMDSASGKEVFDRLHCGVCHAVSPEGEPSRGPNSGPNLWGVAWDRTEEWMRGHITDPQAASPATTMPDFPLEEDELDALVAWLKSLH